MAADATTEQYCDQLWRNARLATLSENLPDLGIIEHGAIAVRDGRILYAGPEADMPRYQCSEEFTTDCAGRWITPGLVDCHTHIVYAGDRAREFELRLKGASYEEIARNGGGIVSTVKALRSVDEDELLRQTLPRVDALIAEGLTTLEVKSGYGLDLENERKSLRTARRLGKVRDLSVTTTFLGAHAVPPEFSGDSDTYINKVIEDILPAIAEENLADAVDGFCEGIAFSPDEISRVFTAAKSYNLPVKLHAEQLSNLHGAALAAMFDALSADHLEYIDEESIAAMAKAGTVAVLLPGAFYFMRETKIPPLSLMRSHKVPIALATDSNPGTSPLTSLLLTMNMAATMFRMTVDECIAGVTREGARALGLLAETGTLEAGKWADLAIWDIDRPAELVYRINYNPLHKRIWRGK